MHTSAIAWRAVKRYSMWCSARRKRTAGCPSSFLHRWKKSADKGRALRTIRTRPCFREGRVLQVFAEKQGLPSSSSCSHVITQVVVLDVGGTHARFALA